MKKTILACFLFTSFLANSTEIKKAPNTQEKQQVLRIITDWVKGNGWVLDGDEKIQYYTGNAHINLLITLFQVCDGGSNTAQYIYILDYPYLKIINKGFYKVGQKGQFHAKEVYFKDNNILILGSSYKSSDPSCCPSEPKTKILDESNGSLSDYNSYLSRKTQLIPQPLSIAEKRKIIKEYILDCGLTADKYTCHSAWMNFYCKSRLKFLGFSSSQINKFEGYAATLGRGSQYNPLIMYGGEIEAAITFVKNNPRWAESRKIEILSALQIMDNELKKIEMASIE